MQYQILSCARKHLGQGGPKRIGFTLPPIVVSSFQLSKQFYDIRETVSNENYFDPLHRKLIHGGL